MTTEQTSERARLMRKFSLIVSIAVLVLQSLEIVAGVPLFAAQYDRKNSVRNQFILNAKPDEVGDIAARNGLEIVSAVDAESGVYLVRTDVSVPPEWVEELVSEEENVRNFELVTAASLPELGDASIQRAMTGILEQSTTGILESAGRKGGGDHEEFNRFFGAERECIKPEDFCLWAGYTDQQAAMLLGIHEGHELDKIFGAGIVAIIDTGIDPDHPVLMDAVLPGYDFILDHAGFASEWSGLDQSTTGILEQSTTGILEQSTTGILEGAGVPVIVNQSTAVVLEQSTTGILEGLELPPAFGHGTMVAGVIRLVAPGAYIMPLRAFDSHGYGHVFDIIRAIYYAVDNGADVINMSFSMTEFSPELLRAVNYAYRHGVVCIASAGNAGSDNLVYPAAFSNVLGVASTSLYDERSPFSNHGNDLVALAAPGEAIVTTFPGGLYAVGFGTSFSAPFAAGGAALLTKPEVKTDLTTDGKKKSSLVEAQVQGALAFLNRFALLQGTDGVDADGLGIGRLNVLSILQTTKVELKSDKHKNEIKVH